MKLVHKSLSIHPQIWRKLRIHAELSDVPLRDFLAYLIDRSSPIGVQTSSEDRLRLQQIVEMQARGVHPGVSADPA
jgi:hypothetical protein